MYTKIFVIPLKENNNIHGFQSYEKYLCLISPEKQNKILRYRSDTDKKLLLLSDLFIRYLICNILKLNNHDLSFSENRFGKPFLMNDLNFHYNITHTKAAIAVAVSKNPIGIDIEKITDAKLYIAEKFFHRNERDYILHNPQKKDQYFYEIWTKKEAYIKWQGKGLHSPLSSFDVMSANIMEKFTSMIIHDYIISTYTIDEISNRSITVFDEGDLQNKLKFFELY